MKVFVSYRRNDSRYLAEPVRVAIDSRFGEGSAFLDTVHIEFGADYRQRLEQAIRDSDYMVVLIGPNWQVDRLDDEDDPVRFELLTAQEQGVRVIPAVHSDESMPTRRTFPRNLRWLADINAFRFTTAQQMTEDLSKLLAMLVTPAVPERDQPAEVPLTVAAHDEPGHPTGPHGQSLVSPALSEIVASLEAGNRNAYNDLVDRHLLLRDDLELSDAERILSEVELVYWEPGSFAHGQGDKSVSDLQRLARLAALELGASHRITLHTKFRLAEKLGETGDAALSVRALQALIVDQTKLIGRKEPDTCRSRLRLAHWLTTDQQPAEAVKVLKALALDQSWYFGVNPSSFPTNLALGRAQLQSRDPKRARKTLRDLLSQQLRVLSSDELSVLETRFWLACAQVESGNPGEGEKLLEQVLRDQQRILGKYHAETLRTDQVLARLRHSER